MRLKKNIFLLVLAIVLLISNNGLLAQTNPNTWKRHYVLDSAIAPITKVLSLPGDRYLTMSGRSSLNPGMSTMLIDGQGDILDSNQTSSGNSLAYLNSFNLTGGDIGTIFTQKTPDPNLPDSVYVVVYDSSWNERWNYGFEIDFFDYSWSGFQRVNGNIILVGNKRLQTPPPQPSEYDMRIFAFSITGQKLWEHSYGLRKDFYRIEGFELANGDLMFNGNYEQGVEVFRVNDQGGNFRADTFAIPYNGPFVVDEVFNHRVRPAENGGFIASALVTTTNSSISGGEMLFLARLDSLGNFVFSKAIPFSPAGIGISYMDLAVHPDGRGAMVGHYFWGSGQHRMRVVGFDANLDFEWERDYALKLGDINNVLAAPDGGYITGGYRYVQNHLGHLRPRPYITRMDSLGKYHLNQIEGKIFADLNYNCIFDSTDIAIPHLIVSSLNSGLFSFTDQFGNYELELDPGNQLVTNSMPPGNFERNCQPSDTLSFSFAGNNDTIWGVDIPLQTSDTCPALAVHLTTGAVRPCSSAIVTINYSNYGIVPAYQAYVDVTLDPGFTLIPPSIPYTTIQPNVYRFQLDTINPFESGSFTFTAQYFCDSIIGRAFCNEAHIYPDAPCTPPNSAWSGASLAAKGECVNGDTVRLTVENVGSNAMLGGSRIIIVEDDIMRRSDTISLPAGGSSIYNYVATGKTYAIFAEQVPNHPGNSTPRAFVEGCGTDSSGQISTGHVAAHPQDDNALYIDIDCQETVGSYDPNDKHGYPLGIGSDNFILERQGLDYVIRFQNVGTDTAFKVVIRDQISEEFDLGTFQMLSSSHPNISMAAYPDRVIEWTFSPIALVDSATNPIGSQGFVKFHIDQKPGNSPGTQLTNYADIYFDFNAPIRTNTSLHTIFDNPDELVLVSIDQQPDEPHLQHKSLSVYPNPFRDQTTFVVEGQLINDLQLKLFDTSGKMVAHRAVVGSNQLELSRDNLPKGLYFFRITSSNGFVRSGKLLAR